MSNHNDITGDKLISKTNTKAYEDNYDKIFGKANAKNKWQKHDGNNVCPVDLSHMVEVETWTPNKINTVAHMLDWKYVKYYRVVNDD